MFRSLALGLVAVTACAYGGSARFSSPLRDEAVQILMAQARDWTRGDVEAFCSAYDHDAVFISPAGLTRGRAEILARYRRKYPSRERMGALELEPLDLVAAQDETALALILRWTLHYRDSEPSSGLSLVVMRRTDDGLRIVHDASM